MLSGTKLLFEKKDLRPYLLFAYKSLNPGGGLHDLRATFKSKRDAFLYLIGMKNHPYCVHLVDIESLELRDDIDFYGYYQEWYSHYYIRKEQDDSKFETKIIEGFRVRKIIEREGDMDNEKKEETLIDRLSEDIKFYLENCPECHTLKTPSRCAFCHRFQDSLDSSID